MRLHGDKSWTVCLHSAIKVKIQIQETVQKCKLSNFSSCQVRLLQNGNVTMFLRPGKVLNKSLLIRICERFFNAAPTKPSWKLSAFRLEIPASGSAEIAKQDHTLVDGALLEHTFQGACDRQLATCRFLARMLMDTPEKKKYKHKSHTDTRM